MVELVLGKTSGRKLRLLICAICRRGIDNIRASSHQNGLEVAEQYADGVASDDDRHTAYRETTFRKRKNWPQMHFEAMVHNALAPDDELAPLNALHRVSNPRARTFQTALLREMFGNPFRPVAFSHSWRTDTALSLARQMYESRDFSAMPILADALQDAGCDNEAILNHCRQPGEHVRGCWVVDLVLGKE